jgi:hypothetical protein
MHGIDENIEKPGGYGIGRIIGNEKIAISNEKDLLPVA